MRITRRTFLGGSLAAGAATVLPGSRVLGANSDIRVAVIGFNGQGQGHIDRLLKIPGVRLVALCDVDPAVLARTMDRLAKLNVDAVGYTDLRRVFDRSDIDAVTTATPNHWHALIGIWACQSGKDAYIEKPISHNVWEGRQLVKAARKYRRVVQGGTQNRSRGALREAVDWVRQGNLGRIRAVYGTCYKPRMSIGKVGHGEIPPGLDYHLWTGPAPLKPLRRAKLHYDWHWFYDTGNGDMGNQGIHQMDVARWFLGVDEISPRVISIGGRLGYEDDGETPNTQIVYHDYEKAPLIFETRGLPSAREYRDDPKVWAEHMDTPLGLAGAKPIGVVVECEGGWVIDGDRLAAYDRSGALVREFKGGAAYPSVGHIDNFIEAVRARNPAMLNADCEVTHLSSALCHTGMISHQLGRMMPQGEIRERLQGDRLASERFESMKEHLARNGVDLSSAQITLGPWLEFDPKRERCTNHREAGSLLRPKYRRPFVVPERV